MWYASPLRMWLPSARIRPALIPMPARCDTYLTIADDVALIESRLSPHSINTHELNWRVGVRTPAIIGVGNDILNNETAS